MDNNRCIRILADANQIKSCKEDVTVLQGDFKDFANILNLAGNEVRLKILYLIYTELQMCVCDLSDVLEMKVPAISQHLRKLKDGGLVIDKKVGQTIYYSIIEQKTEMLMPILNNLKASSTKEIIELKTV